MWPPVYMLFPWQITLSTKQSSSQQIKPLTLQQDLVSYFPQYLIRNHFGRYKGLQSYIPLKEQSLHKSKKSQTHNEVYGNLLLRQNSLGLADCSPHGTVLQVWILHMQWWKKKKKKALSTPQLHKKQTNFSSRSKTWMGFLKTEFSFFASTLLLKLLTQE